MPLEQTLVSPAPAAPLAPVRAASSAGHVLVLRNDTPPADSTVDESRARVASDARGPVVHADADAGYASLEVALPTVFPRLTPEQRERFGVEVWAADVRGTDAPGQRRVPDRAVDPIGQLHSQAAAPAASGDHAAGGR